MFCRKFRGLAGRKKEKSMEYGTHNEEEIIELQVKKSQKRLVRDIKEGFGYHHLTHSTSNKSIRNMTSKRLSMTVMVIDLVGSTKLSAEIHPMRLGSREGFERNSSVHS